LKMKKLESVNEWIRDILCWTKGLQPPKNMALCTRRWNMIYDCVIYVQTQYVDLYIIWSLHTPLSQAVSYKDTARGRMDIWSRDFTQNVSGPTRKLVLLSTAAFRKLELAGLWTTKLWQLFWFAEIAHCNGFKLYESTLYDSNRLV
jgi:hypothetical protein